MRTHEEDLSPVAHCQVGRTPRMDGSAVAQRALAEGRPEALSADAVQHLQRTAGNASVSSMLDQDEPSPVLGVVGSGGGHPLDQTTRGEMEAGFGSDFGDVRVHSDAKASESAKSVHAQAYTVGNDVVFGEGNYSPGTDTGKRMLAHELTHVVQQRSGPVDGTPMSGGVSVSHPSDRFEQAAEHQADQVMSGSRAGGESTATAAQLSLQRASEEEGAAAPDSVVQRQGEEEEEEPAQA